MFLQGRQCENQGLGIGAFTYYRRVVENQKSRILKNVIKVAEPIGAPLGMIETLKKAEQETQFKKAMDLVAGAVPEESPYQGPKPSDVATLCPQ